MRLNQVRPLPISPAHALAVADLPQHHRDPFDRILVAQARIEGLTLITADRTLELYDAVKFFAWEVDAERTTVRAVMPG